jgi:hypothetical protein
MENDQRTNNDRMKNDERTNNGRMENDERTWKRWKILAWVTIVCPFVIFHSAIVCPLVIFYSAIVCPFVIFHSAIVCPLVIFQDLEKMEDTSMGNQKNKQINGRMKNYERKNNGRMKNDSHCLSFGHFSFDHWFVCSSDYLCWYLPSFLSPVVIFHSAIDLFVLLITHASIFHLFQVLSSFSIRPLFVLSSFFIRPLFVLDGRYQHR